MRLRFALSLVVFITVATACHPGPNPIHYGETVSSSLSVPGEVDRWRFEGATGDRLFVRLRRTSGFWHTSFVVERANGEGFCGGSNIGDVADTECALPATEVYRVRVSDLGHDHTGNYTLHVQRLNPPVPLPPLLRYGAAPASGSIAPAWDIDNYRFKGVSGDQLLARVRRTSGALGPYIEVRRQNGDFIFPPGGGSYCAADGPGPVVDLECQLPATETYLIRVADRGDSTGNFTIALRRLDPAGARSGR